MTPSRTRDHVRSNAVAYLALFFAITGTAAAITPQIQGPDIADQAVGTRALRDHGIRKADIGTGAVGAAAVKDRSLTGVDVADDSLGGAQIDETTFDPSVLQYRVGGSCPVGEAIRAVGGDGTATCESTGKGTLTGVTTSGGLTGGGTSGTVDVGADPTQLQKRVTGGCAGNNAVRSVGQDGSVGCGPFVTSVAAGSGLLGGTITNAGTLSVDPTAVQSRVSDSCAAGNAIRSINQNGTVACEAAGTGTVTSVGVASGSGLTASPSPITTSGSIGTDFSVIQKRVSSGCTGQEAIQTINSSGGTTCSESHLLFSGVVDTTAGGPDVTLFEANGMRVFGRCSPIPLSRPVSQVFIEPTGGGSVVGSSTADSSGFSFTASAAQQLNDATRDDLGYFNAYLNSTGESLDGSWQNFVNDSDDRCIFEGSAMFS